MLRTASIAAIAVMMTAPVYAMGGCNYGKHSASADASTYVPEYSPTAASATTIEDTTPLQSAPIDDSALVYESDALIDTTETVILPEG